MVVSSMIERLLKAFIVCFFCTFIPHVIVTMVYLPWYIPPSLLYFFGGMTYASYLKRLVS